jgi:hypothetical protein
MRYWEGPPPRPATGTLPFSEHRTLARVQADEEYRERLRANTEKRRSELRKQLNKKDDADATGSPDI